MPTAQISDEQVLELGAKLRSARETQRRDLSDSAFRIALSPSQLRALEAGDRRPFYSTHYFLQAVDRYAAFLGISLPELETYRAPPPSPAATDLSPKPAETMVVDDIPDAEPSVRRVSNWSANATSPPATIPQRSKAAGTRRQPRFMLLLVGASVITLAAVVLFQDNATIVTSKAVVEPQTRPATATDAAAPTAAASSMSPTPSDAPKAEPPATAPVASVAAPRAQPTLASPSPNDKDVRIQSGVNAWVQIVTKSGERSNLRIAAGESIELMASETAAVVIGQPEKSTLTVRGKTVDLKQHIVNKEGSPRALIIIGDVLR